MKMKAEKIQITIHTILQYQLNQHLLLEKAFILGHHTGLPLK